MGGDTSPQKISELSEFISIRYPKIKTAWYSGREKLPEGFEKGNLNFIKLGGYIEKYGPLKSKTSNQHLYEVQPNGVMKDISYMFWN